MGVIRPMDEITEITHQRVDDIPLLIHLIEKLGIGRLIDKILGTHGNHHGISNGGLATGWLAFILSEATHSKYNVQDWAERHSQILEPLLGKPIRSVEFNDDRLTNLARRFSNDADWHQLEEELWQHTVEVYELPVEILRMDATTVQGYHDIKSEKLMQRGYNSIGREVPQLKLMMAAAQVHQPPVAIPLASDIVAGNRADQPLYTPLIQRVRRIIQRKGLLYIGDSKMSSLATRADLAANGDYYLTPLPTQSVSADWIDAAITGAEPVISIVRDDEEIALGYEMTRRLSVDAAQQTPAVNWTERVQVLRAASRAERQYATLLQHLQKAEQAIWKLTPEPGPGRRQFSDEAQLHTAIATIMQRHDVDGLLHVEFTWEQTPKPRFRITQVQRQQERIDQAHQRLGWVVEVTNIPVERMSLQECLINYRDAWSLERNFHLLKDCPLGIAPLLVHREDQIIGLTRLLLLALRVLTLAELQMRQSLAQDNDVLQGLYPGQPTQATTTPTASAVLKAIVRAEITLTSFGLSGKRFHRLTALPPTVLKILHILRLDPQIYFSLVPNSS